MTDSQKKAKSLSPGLKFILDFIPIILFFFVNRSYDLMYATAALMIGLVFTLGLTYILTKHIPKMPLYSGIAVMVFGGITLILNDETFIKIKVTIIYSLFGLILSGGLLFKRNFLKAVFDMALHLDDLGWRKMTIGWIIGFFGLAITNEIVWRTLSSDDWVTFKLLTIPIILVYSVLMILFIRHHMIDPDSLKKTSKDLEKDPE